MRVFMVTEDVGRDNYRERMGLMNLNVIDSQNHSRSVPDKIPSEVCQSFLDNNAAARGK